MEAIYNSALSLSYPFFPSTTPYAPPPFPNISLRSETMASGFSQAAKCPPSLWSLSKTTGPSVRPHVFGTMPMSLGKYARPSFGPPI